MIIVTDRRISPQPAAAFKLAIIHPTGTLSLQNLLGRVGGELLLHLSVDIYWEKHTFIKFRIISVTPIQIIKYCDLSIYLCAVVHKKRK